MTDVGFVPTGAAAAVSPAAPTDDLGFVPSGSGAAPAAAPAQGSGGGFGQFALNAGKGALGLLQNNPISHALTSLSAMPVQGLAKAMGQPDPYANGAMSGFNVTSSDQPASKYLEEQGGNALTLGSLFIPAGAAADSVTGGAGLLGAGGRIAANTSLGALQGLGGGMQAGQGGEELKTSAGVGAALGFGLSTAGELGSAIVSNLASKTPESQLDAQTNRLKTLQNSFDDNTTFTKNPTTGQVTVKSDPISTLTNTGLVKSLKVVDGRINTEDVDAGLQQMMASNDAKSTQLVRNIPGTVSLEDFKNGVIDAVKSNSQIRDAGKLPQALAEVARRFNSYTQSFATMGDDGETVLKDEITYPTINNIRIAMNREYDPEMKDVARTIGNTARDLLYDESSGSPELQQVMSNQGDLLKAQNFVDRLRGTVVKGGRLGKYIADLGAGVVGGIAGAPFGPLGSGVAGMASAATADKLVGLAQSNYFNPALSRPAQGLSRFLGSPATQGAFSIGKSMLIPSAVQQ